MNRVCIFFTTGYEEIEGLTVVDVLRRAGIAVEMVSVTKEIEVSGSHGIPVRMDKLFEEVDFEQVDMLVLPGGPGTKALEAHQKLMAQVEAFDRAGKNIAAICAAPSILGHKGILKGKRACAYPGYEDELAGAQVSRKPTETDGNIVTGRGMGCSIDFALAIVSKLLGEEKARELAEKIIYSHFE